MTSAAMLLEESLAFFRMQNDKVNLGANLMNLGWLCIRRVDHRRARELFDEVIPLANLANDPVQEAVGLAGCGFLAFTEGDLHAAATLARQALAHLQEIRHAKFTGFVLDLLAVIAAAQGQAERAARLFGASETVRDRLQSGDGFREEILRPARDRYMAAVQSKLAAPRFGAAWAEGRSLSLEEAVTYALAYQQPVSTAARRISESGEGGPLSPREREVVVLVARGLSNREIAARLVITERTAGAHVEHILDKLGFASRTQIGVWASEHGLISSGPT